MQSVLHFHWSRSNKLKNHLWKSLKLHLIRNLVALFVPASTAPGNAVPHPPKMIIEYWISNQVSNRELKLEVASSRFATRISDGQRFRDSSLEIQIWEPNQIIIKNCCHETTRMQCYEILVRQGRSSNSKILERESEFGTFSFWMRKNWLRRAGLHSNRLELR